MYIENIVIGKPIVDLWQLLGEGINDKSYEDVTVYDTERFLPRLLAKYGIMQSVSEVRRNKPELVKTLDKLDFLEIKIGRKKVWIVVGMDTDEELQNILNYREND